MPPISLAPRSARYLSVAEREEIAILRAQGAGVRDIARRLRRAPSTVSRELRRNAATRSGGLAYRASTAQWHSDRRAQRPKIAKLAANDRLRSYVQDRLAGTMMAEDGTPVPGPNVGSWSGRRHGRRQDRHWATSWSPQQIAHRLRIEYPDDDSMRVSHEAIYQALYIQGRGALRRELTACLRTGRALRVPRARRRGRGKEFVGPDIMISARPAEAENRAIPGHWEGDLIIGLDSSAIGTLVERTTRFTMLLHLPRMAERGRLRVKNGPALAGHGAEAVRDAITSTIATLPDQLRRSLTWDQGAEMAQHAQLRIDTGLHVSVLRPVRKRKKGSSATPAVRGSAARTRTPTACCASTSPKVLTSIGTVLATLLLSRPHSTADRGRLSVGEPHPKPSTNCYSHTSEDVLRRPLETGLYVQSGLPGAFRPIYAIRPGGSGDISLAADATSNEYVAWSQQRAGAYVPSALVYGDCLYTLHSQGFLTCHDPDTGQEVFGRTRIGGVAAEFAASPWAYNGKIFAASEDGDTYVLEAGPEYRLLGTNSLEERLLATPAIARGSLFIRTASSLWRIAEPGG